MVFRVCGSAVVCFVLACGNGAEDGGGDATALSPEEGCRTKCALQVAAGCARTPADHASSCQLICMAKYMNFPTCTDALRPLDACAIERVEYGCTESGVVTASPTGACANEGARCASCTGDVFACL